MKKLLIFMGMSAVGLINAQTGKVGINIEHPRATLDITGKPITDENKTLSRGVIIPHITDAQKAEFTDKTEGLMIWNTTKKCLDIWNGNSWQCAGYNENSTPATVLNPSLPNGITISEGKHFIASIYDTDYLPYTMPNRKAVWDATPSDNSPEEKVLDYQGSIPASGIKIYIPITATGNAILEEFTSADIAIDPQGEEGVANSNRKVVLSWSQQNITSTTKFIIATIKPTDNRVLNIKKLDLNGGIGNDGKGLLLGAFSLPKSNLSTTERVNYELRAISGIPDKNFNTETTLNNISAYRHRFIYVPVMGPDGKLWLNNNLGADYANMESPHFNPAQQATHVQDYLAYGSSFQAGREIDGYEQVNWSSGAAGEFKIPTHAPYYNINTYKPVHDGCPDGFGLPTPEEVNTLFDAIKIVDTSVWRNSHLKLTAAGSGIASGAMTGVYHSLETSKMFYSGEDGNYATSHIYIGEQSRFTLDGVYASIARFTPVISIVSLSRSTGNNWQSRRCIEKNN